MNLSRLADIPECIARQRQVTWNSVSLGLQAVQVSRATQRSESCLTLLNLSQLHHVGFPQMRILGDAAVVQCSALSIAVASNGLNWRLSSTSTRRHRKQCSPTL